jgi:signal transduction histidine kinase
LTGPAASRRLSRWIADPDLPARLLAGAVVAVVGSACLSASLGDQRLRPVWIEAALAACAAAVALSLAPAQPPSSPWYAGVATRLARPGRPAWAIRLAIVLTAPLAGVGVVAYACAGLMTTLTAPPSAQPQTDAMRTAATGFLGLAVVLAAAGAGLTVGGDGPLWTCLLIGSGLSLFWGAAGTRRPAELANPLADRGTRTMLGLLLAAAGAAWVLSRTGLFAQARGTIAGTLAALAVFALVVGPRWLRTSRLLGAERRIRARAEERASVADHLHDSVLQTLALIQLRANDPAEVGGLARRQERELRDWLLGRPPDADVLTLADGLRAVAAEIEDAHHAEVNVVTVGDVPLDDPTRAVLAAAREALTNAARHAPGAPIFVFSRVDEAGVHVFVHDRGPGFDVTTISPERRGVRESIIARLDRAGGHAEVRSAPGGGCEVALHLGGRDRRDRR